MTHFVWHNSSGSICYVAIRTDITEYCVNCYLKFEQYHVPFDVR
jgi:hypothetical protein